MRKREPRNNKATKAAQRIDYDRPSRRKAKPKGRSVGGPWKRIK